MKKSYIIIFSGFNFRAIIAFIRTLESLEVPYGIIAKDNSDEIFQTIYRKNVLAIRQKVLLDLKDLIRTILIVQEKNATSDYTYIIAPSTEALNRFILEYLEFFKKINCVFPTVSKKLYETISDKYSFSQLCKKYNINIPEEYTSINNINFPVVAKPKKYFAKDKNIYSPQIIYNKKDLKKFQTYYSIDDFYFQEYISGKSIYLLYYFNKDQKVFKFSQENLIQQENGGSMILSRSAKYHSEFISRKFENLFIDLAFRGLVMIELKLVSNQFYMIEANPRFWGPSQLFVDANINFFRYFLDDYSVAYNQKKVFEPKDNIIYFWDDGISYNINGRKNLLFYNYTRKEFLEDKLKFKKNEVYNRFDSIKLYKGKK